MIRKGILLAAVVLLSTAGLVHAKEKGMGLNLSLPTLDDLSLEYGATYNTRDLWHGMDLAGNNHSTTAPFANVDLGGGWTFGTTWTRPNSSGRENFERIDYTLMYEAMCWAKMWCATMWQFGWTYTNYPDGPVRHRVYSDRKWNMDRQEFFATMQWPNACSYGIIPFYSIFYVKPSDGGRRSNASWDENGNSYWRQGTGFLHTVGLLYDLPVPNLLPNRPDQTIRLSTDMTYNGGVGRRDIDSLSRDVDNDWTHVNWGIQTDIGLNNTATLTPGFRYQTTMDKSINKSDEWMFFLMLTMFCD